MAKRLAFFLLLARLSAQGTSQDPVSAPVAPIDPLGWHGRWDSYLDKTYNWKRIGVVAAESTLDQMFSPRACGRPPFCFHRSFERDLARRTTRTTIELAVGGLLHQDIRRRPSELSGFRQRVQYALIHAPLARARNGEWEPAYTRFAGTLGGIAISAAIQDRSFSDSRVYRSVGWSFTSYFQDALWAEFEPDLKRMALRFGQRLRRHSVVPSTPASKD